MVDVDAASEATGTTPLLIAAREGNEEAMRLLIVAGADVNKADKDDASPVHVAAREGHGALVATDSCNPFGVGGRCTGSRRTEQEDPGGQRHGHRALKNLRRLKNHLKKNCSSHC